MLEAVIAVEWSDNHIGELPARGVSNKSLNANFSDLEGILHGLNTRIVCVKEGWEGGHPTVCVP